MLEYMITLVIYEVFFITITNIVIYTHVTLRLESAKMFIKSAARFEIFKYPAFQISIKQSSTESGR